MDDAGDLPDFEGWHYIIKGVLHDRGIPEYIKNIPGACAGEHIRGKKTEKPHYHIWFPRSVDAAGIFKRIKVESPDLTWLTHGNAYHTLKDHNSFEAWVKYVFYNDQDCKEPKVIFWNRPDSPPSRTSKVRLLDELILPAPGVEDGIAHPGVTTPVVAVASSPYSAKDSNKTDPAYKRFLVVCKATLGPRPSLDDVIEQWFLWTKGNYEMKNVSGPVRYAYYVLNEENPEIRASFCREIRRKLFSDH